MQKDVSESKTHQFLFELVSEAFGLAALMVQLLCVSKNPAKGIPANKHLPQADAKAVDISTALMASG